MKPSGLDLIRDYEFQNKLRNIMDKIPTNASSIPVSLDDVPKKITIQDVLNKIQTGQAIEMVDIRKKFKSHIHSHNMMADVRGKLREYNHLSDTQLDELHEIVSVDDKIFVLDGQLISFKYNKEDFIITDQGLKLKDVTIKHGDIESSGKNSYYEIDSHIENVDNPHLVNKGQLGLNNVTNDKQLKDTDGSFHEFTIKKNPEDNDVILIENKEGMKKLIKIKDLKVIGPVGPKGDKGDTGDKGLRGFRGLRGDTGNQGEEGENGDRGSRGLRGLKGDKGEIGAGMMGSRGHAGATGPQGSTGSTGMTGLKGETAYEIWVNLGNIGTEQDFIDSLKGVPGPSGVPGEQGDSFFELDGDGNIMSKDF